LYLKNSKCSSKGEVFQQKACRLLEKLENEEIELIPIVARKIWLLINTIVFGGDLTHPAQLVRSAKEAVVEFYETKQKAKNNMERIPATFVPKWMFISYSAIKINWDAVIDKNKKEDGCEHNGNHERKGLGN
jgi:hypothetical protein